MLEGLVTCCLSLTRGMPWWRGVNPGKAIFLSFHGNDFYYTNALMLLVRSQNLALTVLFVPNSLDIGLRQEAVWRCFVFFFITLKPRVE